MNENRSLQELLDAAVTRHGVSMRQLAAKARGAGFSVVDTTLNSIRNGTYKSRPREETVRAIGWLAGVSDTVAFTAAGLPVPGPPFADELPPGVDTLSPRKRKAVIELLRVLIDDEEVTGNAEHPAPTSDPQPDLMEEVLTAASAPPDPRDDEDFEVVSRQGETDPAPDAQATSPPARAPHHRGRP